jgi:HxlR-like helix-turn-helix
MSPDRIYRHFCMTARALEVVGERWSLLIVRELLLGPRRFTDLVRGLAEITPTRLTGRLRNLEAAGVIEAGLDLRPVIDALTLWGIEHARQGPLAGEPVHAEPAMIGTKVWLNRYAAKAPDGLAWVWRFPGDDYYTLRFTAGAWELARGRADPAAVTVVATREAWASFLTMPRAKRRLRPGEISLEGSQAELKRFAKAFAAKISTG